MRVLYFSKWVCSQLRRSIKRRLIIVFSGITIFVIFLHWNFTCPRDVTLHLIQNLCTSFASGETFGNLCKGLCQPEAVSSLSCRAHHNRNSAVFTGTWLEQSVILKSVKKISMGKDNTLFIDDEDKLVKTIIKSKFNMTIDDYNAKKLLAIQSSLKTSGQVEVENILSLLQDNEYIALLLYEEFGIFPKLLGSCGPMYAVEKVNTMSSFSHLISLYDSREEWIRRVNVSIMIMDYIKHVETELPEPLMICNANLDNFGMTDDFKKVIYFNLDSVHPLSVASKLTNDGSACREHSDCDYLHCRSFCNLITLKCQHGVVNNNLQIVCERIFLGWVLSGRVTVPGLLLGPRTPRVLTELLEQCANPDNDNGMPRAPASKEIRTRLYNLLTYLRT